MDKVLFTELNQHHAFCLLKAKVYELCKPLLTNLPVEFYIFERYYYDYSYLGLSTDSDALPEYAQRENVMPDIDLIDINTSHYVFLSEEVPLPPVPGIDLSLFSNNLKLAKDLLGITHRLSLTFNTPQYVEIHSYGIKKEVVNVIYFFMNHLKALEFFCKYFRSAGHQLIKEAEKNKVFIFSENFPRKNNNGINYNNNYELFLKEIRANRYDITGKRGTCSLSARELECLVLTANNKTAKEIGKLLCLSPRTVEEYLLSLRTKLGCNSKSELLQIAHDNPLIETFSELFAST